MKTVILGGGLTGVTLLRLLKEQGEDVLVLEQSSRPGGLCRSISANGFTFDMGGSHIIFSRDTEVLSFMHKVLGNNRGERDRDTKVRFKDRYVRYPFENGLSDLSKEDCFTCLNEFIKNRIAIEKGEVKDPKNFHDWILYTFGKGIGDAYLIPYNEKIWNYSLDKMSMHWVAGRVPTPPVEDIIKSAVGIETQGYTHQAVFSYPIYGGIEALIKAICVPVNDFIRTGFIVRSVKKSVNGRWEISDGKETIIADKVISTIPLQGLLSAMSEIPERVNDAICALKYNSVVCIGIGLNGRTLPYSWVYLPGNDHSYANRVSFPSNFSDNVAPHGCSSVLAEITYNDGDDISKMSDKEIIEHVVNNFGKAGIISPSDVIETVVFRNPFAYVVYDLEWQQNMEIIRSYFRDTGISLLGRFSQFEYLNMDGIIRSVFNFLSDKEAR